jgi:hypothetical protein
MASGPYVTVSASVVSTIPGAPANSAGSGTSASYTFTVAGTNSSSQSVDGASITTTPAALPLGAVANTNSLLYVASKEATDGTGVTFKFKDGSGNVLLFNLPPGGKLLLNLAGDVPKIYTASGTGTAGGGVYVVAVPIA